MAVWKSSKQTWHTIRPVFLTLSLGLFWSSKLVPPTHSHIFSYILTWQDFSWLQNGQVNWVSSAPVIFFFGGGFLFDFLLPILN